MLFLSSELALDMIHYGFIKTVGLAVSRGLAKRVAGTGGTVNALFLGPILSDGLDVMFREAQQASDLSME